MGVIAEAYMKRPGRELRSQQSHFNVMCFLQVLLQVFLAVKSQTNPKNSLMYILYNGNKIDILLMIEILHQLIGSFSYYLQGFIHPGGARFQPSTVLTEFAIDFL